MFFLQIVCNRMTNTDHNLVQRIKLLLEDNFYVPVLRSEDNCTQPVIGEPFSPTTPPVSIFRIIPTLADVKRLLQFFSKYFFDIKIIIRNFQK